MNPVAWARKLSHLVPDGTQPKAGYKDKSQLDQSRKIQRYDHSTTHIHIDPDDSDVARRYNAGVW